MVIFNSVLKIRKKVVWVKALFQRAVKIRTKLNQQRKYHQFCLGMDCSSRHRSNLYTLSSVYNEKNQNEISMTSHMLSAVQQNY